MSKPTLLDPAPSRLRMVVVMLVLVFVHALGVVAGWHLAPKQAFEVEYTPAPRQVGRHERDCMKMCGLKGVKSYQWDGWGPHCECMRHRVLATPSCD